MKQQALSQHGTMKINIMKDLIEKYNVAAPRYTSYPTVPCWDPEVPAQQDWALSVIDSFEASNCNEGISLYIHLPFCESLCTYCGCNTRITVNHAVESPYIDTVLKEWSMYRKLLIHKPRIREIHLGGGTPTFFSALNLERLINGILDGSELCEDAELSFEAHPANTTEEHLSTLHRLGFRRLSLGIQDFDEKVQDVIHRRQSVEQVRRVTELARQIGYTSVNYDLIYGLPLQTRESISRTIDAVITLRPDRIAFYSYAHVPWLKPGQRKFTELDLPEGKTKRLLYECGKLAFLKAGYREIGLDHFALPQDPLLISREEGSLHRNFMGYTVTNTSLLIGLGVSSISDSSTAFVQNEKKLEDYYRRISSNQFPFMKGHLLTDEDLIIRQHILNIMCRMETSWEASEQQCAALFEGIERLKEAQEDGFVAISGQTLRVEAAGEPFLRNICMMLDSRYWKNIDSKAKYSKSI